MAKIGPELPWGRFGFSKGVKGIREKITLSKMKRLSGKTTKVKSPKLAAIILRNKRKGGK